MRPPRSAGRGALPALALFVLLAVAHTWPLASRPGTWSRVDNGDMLLNAWAMAWVAHQAPRDPRHLFDANIFWPERRTLAYSEHLVLQGLLGLPIRAAGGSPVLAHNLVMLAGFALTGWAFGLLVWRWTASWSAGLVAGSLAAFNSHTLTRLAHVQAVHLEFVPLALLALDRLLADRRVRDAVLLGSAVTLQGLSSLYLLVFTAWAMVFAGVARLDAWARPRRARLAAALALAVAVAVVTSLPFVLPYYRVSRDLGLSRSPGDARFFAAWWQDYLATGSRLHVEAWSRPFVAVAKSPTFPGVAALALALVALARREAWRDTRCRMAVGVTVGGIVMSVLPWAPFYPWVHEHVPLFRVIRATSRFGIVALMGLAVLAGLGVARLRRHWQGDGRSWAMLTVVLVVLVNAEAWRAPLWYARFAGIPPVYGTLRDAQNAVVVELPFPPARGFFHNAPYMLNSTAHWRPMLNGYSGFLPRGYEAARRAAHGLPAADALAALHALGVTHIVVHADRMGDEFVGRLEAHHAIGLVAVGDAIRIYRLRR